MTSDLDLLGQFARGKSQDAFTALVSRHVNLVYSAALRQVRSPQLAEEITQSVFADLARDAGKISGTGVSPVNSVTPWLYAVTRRTAIDVIRKESRRQLREQIAVEMNNMNATANEWAQIEPLLDDAMAALDETDRTAILLRYFENKNLREIGAALGTSDDTAQKRVSRAVEQLREFFTKRNVTIGATGLAVLISTNAVQATPAGMAVTISSAAILAGTVATNSTVIAAATKTVAMTTLQKIAVTTALAVTIGAGIYQATQTRAARAEVRKIQARQAPMVEQLQMLQNEQESASNTIAGLRAELALNEKSKLELMKLRGQVGQFQNQIRSLQASGQPTPVPTLDENDLSPDTTLGRINLLKSQLKKHPEWSIPEIQFLRDQDWMNLARGGPRVASLTDEAGIRLALSSVRHTAKTMFGQRLWGALASFAADNAGYLPVSPSLLKPYLDRQKTPPDLNSFSRYTPGGIPSMPQMGLQNYPPTDEALLQRYQMIQTGATNAIRANQYVLAEKSPVDNEYDTLMQVGLGNLVLTGVGKDNSIGWSGTPDLTAMTPEQRQRYAKSSAAPAAPKQSEIQQLNNHFDEQWQKMNDQYNEDLNAYLRKHSAVIPSSFTN